jgi:hypothetical protein
MTIKEKLAFSVLALAALGALTLLIVICIMEPFTLVALGGLAFFGLMVWAVAVIADYYEVD